MPRARRQFTYETPYLEGPVRSASPAESEENTSEPAILKPSHFLKPSHAGQFIPRARRQFTYETPYLEGPVPSESPANHGKTRASQRFSNPLIFSNRLTLARPSSPPTPERRRSLTSIGRWHRLPRAPVQALARRRTMELTGDQKDFFETFGFLVFRQLLSLDEVATMLRESDDIMEEVRGGSAFDGRKWQAVQPFFERRPFLHSLIIDPRILGIAEGLLGPDIFLDVTEGNLHVGDTPWHGGGNDAEILPHVKIGFYLEPLTKEDGRAAVHPRLSQGETFRSGSIASASESTTRKRESGASLWTRCRRTPSKRLRGMSWLSRRTRTTGRSAATLEDISTPSTTSKSQRRRSKWSCCVRITRR